MSRARVPRWHLLAIVGADIGTGLYIRTGITGEYPAPVGSAVEYFEAAVDFHFRYQTSIGFRFGILYDL